MKNELNKEYDVVIVGAGFSGTMVAVHLARAQRGLRVALIERGKTLGRGMAYGTTDPKHLLNVPADHMGAFPDDIGHFYRWLQDHPLNLALADVHELHPNSFIPRMVFGDYVQDLLREARILPGNQLEVIQGEIVDLKQTKDGHFELTAKDGRILTAARIVLALGNFPPGEARHNQPGARTWFFNSPYNGEAQAKLAEPGDILIVGTGLTSLDLLMTLDQTKTNGTIHLLSRRGLFPQTHKNAVPYPPFLDQNNLPRTARTLLRRVAEELRKAAAKGIDWRPVLDSLRPLNQDIWTNLDAVEQRRFLRHLQPLWDTHRHRCAPHIMAVKERLEREGRLIVHQGNIEGYELQGEDVRVTYRPRGTDRKETFKVRHVLSCTGPQSDYRKLKDELVQRLLARNLLAPDPLRMGAHTTDGGVICNSDGQRIENLYTLGSTQKGRLYESIAVPELRHQAADLAARLLADLHRNEPAQARDDDHDHSDIGKDPRVYLAAERTFLAWIRTGLAFMGFGFVVARFGFFLRQLFPIANSAYHPHQTSMYVPTGLGLIIAGIGMSLYAVIRYLQIVRVLDGGQFRPTYSTSFAYYIATSITAIGLVAAIYMSVNA